MFLFALQAFFSFDFFSTKNPFGKIRLTEQNNGGQKNKNRNEKFEQKVNDNFMPKTCSFVCTSCAAHVANIFR